MNRIYKIMDTYTETDTNTKLEKEFIQLEDIEDGSIEGLHLGLLAYNNDTERYYEDEDKKNKRIDFLNDFFKFEYPDFDSIKGNEYTFWFDPEKGYLMFNEPIPRVPRENVKEEYLTKENLGEYYNNYSFEQELIKPEWIKSEEERLEKVSAEQLQKPFYELEIIDAYIQPNYGIKLVTIADGKLFTLNTLGFTKKVGKKYVYDKSKVPNQIRKLNKLIEGSDLDLPALRYDYMGDKSSNIEILKGVTAVITLNPAQSGFQAFYRISSFQ